MFRYSILYVPIFSTSAKIHPVLLCCACIDWCVQIRLWFVAGQAENEHVDEIPRKVLKNKQRLKLPPALLRLAKEKTLVCTIYHWLLNVSCVSNLYNNLVKKFPTL